MKYIFKILISVVAILLVIVLLSLTYSKYVEHDELTNSFGYTLMKVQSNSMSPYMKKGDKIVIKLNGTYKVGDVVTFRDENVYVTHQIMQIRENDIITKGKQNNTDDEPVLKSDVIGVVKLVI